MPVSIIRYHLLALLVVAIWGVTFMCTGCIISEYDSIDTPEKKRWDLKYCCQ